MRYTLQRTRVDEVRRLCEKFRLDFLDANIFARRGISKADDIRFYLEGGVNNLRSPFLFDDMEEAVERILSAQEEGETVAIFGDRDADGITSTALLCQELETMGLEVKCHLPEGDEPYGLSMKAVEEIHGEGAKLVITVDNGITCLEEVDRLNGYGIDTIVVDHHLAGDELPDALAILDPKAPDSGYPFEHLAGCAVTAKLVWALRFAQTPLYKSHVILLHAEPGPGDVEKSTTVVQAVELYNLVEVERIVEALPNRAVDFDNSRLVRLLMRGLPILVLDSQDELRQLTLAFGPSVDINLVDIRKELEAVIPRTRGKKLFTLATESRAALYADGHEEIETLLSLFTSSCIYKHPQLSRQYADIRVQMEREIDEVVEKARCGQSGAEIDAIARGYIEAAGYGKYFTHRTGHGIGMQIHEEACLSQDNTAVPIMENYCFSVEPGIYIAGKIGVRYEDCFYMTKNGIKQIK